MLTGYCVEPYVTTILSSSLNVQAFIWCQVSLLEPAEPIGDVPVALSGSDVTLVSCMATVPLCLQAAEDLSAYDIHAEVLDALSLRPFGIRRDH